MYTYYIQIPLTQSLNDLSRTAKHKQLKFEIVVPIIL